MLSKTGEYALRAMIYLAQHTDDWPISGARIAAQTRIPAKYLSKIMGDLVRAGVLESARGLGGGFRMSRPPHTVKLFDVLEPFETILSDAKACPFSYQRCSDHNPCLGHDAWRTVRETFERFLRDTSLLEVAVKQKL